MKRISVILALLLTSSLALNAANCSNEKKAQMIMNGIDQATIDSMCTTTEAPATQQPIQVIINNSSNANNANTNTVNATPAPVNPYANMDDSQYIQRSRLYIGLSSASYDAERTVTDIFGNEYTATNTATGADFSLGYVTESNNRWELSSSTIGYDEGGETISGTNLNWIITLGNENVKNMDYRVYFLLGYGTYTYDDSSSDLTGIAGSAGLGVNFSLNENVEFDLGYHVKSISWTDESSSYDIVDSLTGISLAARWKF